MQEIVDGFCLGSIKFAKEKLYLPPKKGGMGLINITEFLTAQHICGLSAQPNLHVTIGVLTYADLDTVTPLQ